VHAEHAARTIAAGSPLAIHCGRVRNAEQHITPDGDLSPVFAGSDLDRARSRPG
jgi:hypothetical protein